MRYEIKRFIYLSKFYIELFFLFLLPILPILIFLKISCVIIELIPDKLADAVFDITRKDYKL